jgi:hypothetical protein
MREARKYNNMSSSSSGLLFYLDQQRYAISVILSFLDEIDGTCMLITNKTLKRMLPLFNIAPHLLKEDRISIVREHGHDNGGDNTSRLKKVRHFYKPLPIQCPAVLLDRLNTERLSRRIRLNCKNSAGIAEAGTKYSYPLNMTTEEIAWTEWTHERSQFITYQQQNTTDVSNKVPTSFYSSKLELLRYRSPPPPSKTIYNFKLQIPQSISSTGFIPKILPGATVLASYPRSGNTLLRTLLERTTGILTGSDTRPDRTLSKALSTLHSLVGEGITSHPRTPVIKTHFPERRGYMMYNASRIILLVRNPYDAIDSYWNMCCTNTHTESVSEEVYDRYREKFQGLAFAEMETWVRFLKYWMLKCHTTFMDSASDGVNLGNSATKKCVGPSILLVRFEDLIQKTEVVMEQVIKFITVDDANGSTACEDIHPFWKWRIRRALGLDPAVIAPANRSKSNDVDTANLGSYKPRSYDNGESKCELVPTKGSKTGEPKSGKTNSIGKSLGKNRYTDQDLLRMHQIAEGSILHHPTKGKVNLLQLLGYDVLKQNFPDNFEKEENDCNWDVIYPHGIRKGKSRSVVRINLGPELRPTDSPFGRAMTRWRKSQTCDDSEPFEIFKKKR